MKLLIRAVTPLAFLVISSCTVQQYTQAPASSYTEAPAPAQPQAQQQGVSLQLFYDQLSPYGQWIQNPQYGYVWIPDVGPDFKPYATDGHWEYTDYGWTWVSDYPWGWAPFHYGRWYYDNIMGYAWIPDTQWGPAWVDWRSSPDYYGWAPMGPAGYSYPQNQWVFVNAGYVNSPQVYNYYQAPQNNYVVYNQTTIIQNNYIVKNNVQYVPGPDAQEVQRRTGTAVVPVVIQQSNQPGQSSRDNGHLTIYKPQIIGTMGGNGARPMPAKVMSSTQIVPVSQRKPSNIHPINNANNAPGNGQVAPQNKRTPIAPDQNGRIPTPAPPIQKGATSTPVNNDAPQPAHYTAAPAQNHTSSTPAPTPQAKPKPKVTKPKPAVKPTPSTAPTGEKH